MSTQCQRAKPILPDKGQTKWWQAVVSAKIFQEGFELARAIGERVAPTFTHEMTSASERLLAESYSAILKSYDMSTHEAGHLKASESELLPALRGEPLKVLPLDKSDLIPKSMTPNAYKVLGDGGTALWDEHTQYPLPKLLPDGKWQPGNWVEPGKSKFVEMVQGAIGGPRETGLYISNNPNMWKASVPGNTTFEVEIGDQKSLVSWHNSHPAERVDFTAQRLRLLRPLSLTEVRAIPTTADDHFGMGLNGILKATARLSRD